MQLPYWPESLQRRLKETFRYNPETGEVTRALMPVKGPKTKGAVGTLSNNNRDVIMTISHEGRQWTIRVAKLALFLHTGNQYKFIDFIDGDRTNFTLKNLVTQGEPLTEAANDPEATKAMLEKARVAMLAKRKTTYVDFVKNETGEFVQQIVDRAERRPVEEKHPDYSLVPQRRAEALAKKRALFEERSGLGMFKKLNREFEARVRVYRYKRGLSNNMNTAEAHIFNMDIKAILGMDCLEYYERKRKEPDYDVETEKEKWMHDVYRLGRYMYIERDTGNSQVLANGLKLYRWKDQEVHQEYDELSEEDTREYLARKAQIEKELGMTEEQLEATWQEIKEEEEKPAQVEQVPVAAQEEP